MEDRIEAKLTEHEAVFDAGALRAVALEQSAGEMSPEEALDAAPRDGRRAAGPDVGGRADDDARGARAGAGDRAPRRTCSPSPPAGMSASRRRASASREVAERIAAPLSREQEQALRTVTGPERLAVLVGPAGTGKGVVIDAAARAEQIAGREVIGVAVSGSTAERLGADSPALAGTHAHPRRPGRARGHGEAPDRSRTRR